MTDKQIMEEIDKERKRKDEPFPFYGLLVAVLSILQGEFIIRVDGYLLSHAEPYMQKLPEQLIGWIFLTGAIVKLIGVLFKIKPMKRWGIWLLGGIWTGMFIVTITFSFGTGYPHPSWIHAFGMMVACFYISFKGDFY